MKKNHIDTCMQVHAHAPTHLDWNNKAARESQPSSCEQALNWAASEGSVWIVLSIISANLLLKQGGAAAKNKHIPLGGVLSLPVIPKS